MTTEGTPSLPAPPANATEAANRLGALTADKEWCEKLLAGNADAGREFRELSELAATGDDVNVAMAGRPPIPESGVLPNSDVVLMADMAAYLRELGFPEKATREFLSDKKMTAEHHAAAKQWKADAMSNKEFTQRYLAGDRAALRQMTAANAVLNSEIAT
jgi:hypothetical protein